MVLLSSDWATVWTMAGMGVGVVFVILVLLVLVLQVFSAVATKATLGTHHAAAPVAKPASEAGDDEKAAIATALYLYFNNTHDEESGVLTIHVEDHPAWHAELNPNNPF